MKRIIAVLGLGALAIGMIIAGALADEARKTVALDGKTLFLDQKCESCHSISAAKIEKKASTAPAGKDAKVPPDLSEIGSKVKADFLTGYLMKTADLNGAKHIKKFKGNNDSLKVLVDWLMTMKAAEKAAGK